jgi:hypothetical protein
MIISELFLLVSGFQGKYIGLLYRGTRDGFRASYFHHRRDGVADTLSLIENFKHSDHTSFYIKEPSDQSDIGRLKDLHNVLARKFRLRPGDSTIFCEVTDRLSFGASTDIRVLDGCNTRNDNYTNLDGYSQNDTGIDRRNLFGGTRFYAVHQIEVLSSQTTSFHSVALLLSWDSDIFSLSPLVLNHLLLERLRETTTNVQTGFMLFPFCQTHIVL